MEQRQKNNLNLTGCSPIGFGKKSGTNQQFSVLPLFPSAPKPSYINRRKSACNNFGMFNNAEDIFMTPCNTILLQTTVDGKIQVSRTQKERNKNPDRLSLDRRGLSAFPILIGEAKLRLLSLQHNLLTKLERTALLCLPQLVFLDIYDNQLENMLDLDCLHHLRVLLLGKNRIKTIEGLSNMLRLEVLDLHGNQISEIKNLKAQNELKVLNLAGNEIRSIGIHDLKGLGTLQEMNLRRNLIKNLNGFEETPQLFKLFLSNNEINTLEDLNSLKKLLQLKELSLDGNPVMNTEDCIFYVVSYIPSVQIFGQTKISDEIKKLSKIWHLRREFNEKVSTSLDESKFKPRLNDDLKRTRSASENRVSYLRKRGVDLKSKFENKNNAAKFLNQINSSSTKCTRSLNKNTKSKHANYVKRKANSIDSCNDSETSVEFFCLPPILTSSLNMDDGNVIFRKDPNLSIKSANNFCGIHCKSVLSEEKTDESLSSSQSENSSTDEDNVAKVCDNTVLVEYNNVMPIRPTEKEKGNVEKTQMEIKTPYINALKNVKSPKQIIRNEKTGEQGKDYLVQISGRYLIVTGKSSVKYIDKPWNVEKANDVTIIKFSYLFFNTLCSVFNRIKYRFPNAEHLIFNECEFNYIGQINSIADFQGLVSLEILPERNAIMNKNWRNYAIFRLHHWGLKTINNISVSVKIETDTDITDDEIKQAKEEYESLSEMVLWSLPETLLTPLLNKLRLEVNSNVSAKDWLYNADSALRSVICKEALQWRPLSSLSQNEIHCREKGKKTLITALEVGCDIVLKLQKLNSEWKTIVYRLVCETLQDYYDMESYAKEMINNMTTS